MRRLAVLLLVVGPGGCALVHAVLEPDILAAAQGQAGANNTSNVVGGDQHQQATTVNVESNGWIKWIVLAGLGGWCLKSPQAMAAWAWKKTMCAPSGPAGRGPGP